MVDDSLDVGRVVDPVLTVDEADELAGRLQEVFNELHTTDRTVDEKLARGLAPVEYRRLLDYLAERKISLDDVEAVGHVLMSVRDFVQQVPVVRVRIAFTPRQAFVTKLKEWLEQHGPGRVRVQMDVDSALVGGAVIEWQGRVHDFSLRERVREVLARD